MVISENDTIENILHSASERLKLDVKRIFCKEGGEINDAEYIRDNDLLYFSEGEDFISHDDSVKSKSHDWLTLNVGGKYFTTSKSTLLAKEPNSMLARMFAEHENGYHFIPSNVDSQGAYLIDRSPTYFEPILNYLRNGNLIYDNNVNPEGILEEARFFGIESIIPVLEGIIKDTKKSRDLVPLTKRDVVNALIMTPHSSELRFQGVNLAGADLSKLDLRFINFKVQIFYELFCYKN